MDLAELMKALADTNRLRILNLLGDQTLCVCDLEEVLKLEQSNLSRHLAKLRQAGLVAASKKGQFVYYSRLTPSEPYGPVLKNLFAAMAQDVTWEKDRQELQARKGCSGSSCS